MAAQVGHEPREGFVIVIADDGERIVMGGEVGLELTPPTLGALEHERRVDLVRTVRDPLAKPFTAREREGEIGRAHV